MKLDFAGDDARFPGSREFQTMLVGADMRTYAVAQGPMIVGGFEAKGNSGSSVKAGSTAAGRVPGGALVEREVPSTFVQNETIVLALRQASFATAQRIVTAVDKELGTGVASANDPGAVTVKVPAPLRGRAVELLSRLDAVEVQPDDPARVVVNERTGTIVAGGDVRLSPVAIAQGGITIGVRETPVVSQPNALSQGGTTQVVPRSDVQATESGPPSFSYINGATSLADVAHALSTLGVGPREMASILQALKAAGALRAEIVMQ